MRGRRGGCLKGRGEKGPRGMAGEDTAKGSGAAPPRPRLSLAHSAGSVFSLKRCRPRGRWAHGAGRVGKSRILTRTVHALGENTDCRGCWPGLACVRGAPVAIREGTLPRTWALLMPPALSWQTGGLGRGRQGSSRDRPDTASGHFSQCVLASRGWDGGAGACARSRQCVAVDAGCCWALGRNTRGLSLRPLWAAWAPSQHRPQGTPTASVASGTRTHSSQ